MKKIISIAILLNIVAASMTVYAIPLDPEHFKDGIWKGTYSSFGHCDQLYSGYSILTITGSYYWPPSQDHQASEVRFVGSLQLLGSLPPGYERDSNIKVGSINWPIPNKGLGYSVVLQEDLDAFFGGGGQEGGFNPITQNIQALGTAGYYYDCRIRMDVNPAY